MQENYNQQFQFEEDTINIREELEKYAYHWKWFVISGVICLIAAYLYLRYTPNQYEVSTTILIDDEKKGGLASELAVFEDLGLMGSGGANLENEIELLKSRSLMTQVVKDLNLNVSLWYKGRVREVELYGFNNPFKVQFLKKDSTFYKMNTSFYITPLSESEFTVTDIEGSSTKEFSFGEAITGQTSTFTLVPNALISRYIGNKILVSVKSVEDVAGAYRSGIQIAPVNKNASVIKLSLKGTIKQKAADVLDKLVEQYNQDAIDDKSEIARNTNAFINERLLVINKDLSNVEAGAEAFKQENNITNIISEAEIVLETKSEINKSIVDLNTQLKLADYMIAYMDENQNELIPANLGLSEASINTNTQNYNLLLLERNRILQGSSIQNPVVVSLDTQISQLRRSIVEGLNNFKSSLTISLSQARQQERLMNNKIAAVPSQERTYRGIEREQQIIEALYLYLLEKREENAITLAVTAPNAKIIDKAYGSNIPVAPKKKIVYLAALLLGGIIPFGVLYISFLLDNKIHSRKEVEEMVKAPFIGDIPKSKQTDKIVVSDEDRSSIAESFRLLRTNINFMLSKVQSESKSIFVTSTLSGEGKTFTSINLASVLALADKKVLLIGGDVRKPKIIDYLDVTHHKGLTHYLMDSEVTEEEIVHSDSNLNFDIVNSGIIPPNPSELLMNGRFDDILTYGKENYDYVIVDTAPVNLVTDTLLIADQADLFIYVIRANYLDKRLLHVPKLMEEEKRLPNMSIVMNDVDHEKGYGYGYGYGYGASEEVSLRKRLWKKVKRN